MERRILHDPVRADTSARYSLGFGAAFYTAGVATSLLAYSHPPASGGVALGLRAAALVLFAWWAFRRRSLTVWILWSMLAGIEIGLAAPAFALRVGVFSSIFLRLIQTIVAPLILGTLITGIAAHGASREVPRLAIKSLVYFEVLTTIALFVGLLAINISKAGVGITAVKATGSAPQPAANPAQSPPQQFGWDQFLLHAFPENLAKSVFENQILQVAVFAVLFGLALGRLSDEDKRPLLDVIQSLTATMFEFTNLIMYFAPVAVGSALAYTVAHAGVSVMIGLAKLLVTLYAAIGVFILIGLLPAALLARVPIRRFLFAVAEPAAIAFATSTSEAALPIAMERMEQLGVPRRIVGFVIPTGYSFNLDGSALYLSLAAVFMAQAAGIHLSWGRQLMLLATLMLTSKGVGGVPRAVLVVLMATASSFQLPVDTIAVLLGVDALMDMGRTTVNVVGNCLASVVIARWEGEFALSLQPDTELAADL